MHTQVFAPWQAGPQHLIQGRITPLMYFEISIVTWDYKCSSLH